MKKYLFFICLLMSCFSGNGQYSRSILIIVDSVDKARLKGVNASFYNTKEQLIITPITDKNGVLRLLVDFKFVKLSIMGYEKAILNKTDIKKDTVFVSLKRDTISTPILHIKKDCLRKLIPYEQYIQNKDQYVPPQKPFYWVDYSGYNQKEVFRRILYDFDCKEDSVFIDGIYEVEQCDTLTYDWQYDAPYPKINGGYNRYFSRVYNLLKDYEITMFSKDTIVVDFQITSSGDMSDFIIEGVKAQHIDDFTSKVRYKDWTSCNAYGFRYTTFHKMMIIFE